MPRDPATVIQLARLGDLIQSHALIRTLAEDRPVRLICDSAVRDWANLLTGLESVHGLDTRAWRERCSSPCESLSRELEDLRREIRTLGECGNSQIYPLNDYPVGNLLAAALCSNHPEDWITERLALVRSYIRLIGLHHSWNRLHLSDLWRALADNPHIPVSFDLNIPQMGTQFAQTVLGSFKRRNIKRVWALILGSGAEYRRLEPEVYAAWWAALPVKDQPGIILLGGPGEEDLAARFLAQVQTESPKILNLVGDCSPVELLGIFDAVDLVVGVDTGPLHWAAAVGTPVLSLYFGEAGFHDTGPYGERHLIVSPDCPEYPCPPFRADDCGRRCRQAFFNPLNMAELLIPLSRGETFTGSNLPGLRVNRSSLESHGNAYVSLDGEAESLEIAAFTGLVRQILGLGSGEEASSDLSPTQRRTIQSLCAAWINEVEQLSFGPAVSIFRQIEIRTRASRRIREAMKAFVSKSNDIDERPAVERCLFSDQLADLGA